MCCMQLPNWKDLLDIQRAFIRQHDPRAEEIFMNVVDGKCPNLIINKSGVPIASCKIYDNRCNFCKAYKCKNG